MVLLIVQVLDSSYFGAWIPDRTQSSVRGMSLHGHKVAIAFAGASLAIQAMFPRVAASFTAMFRRTDLLHGLTGSLAGTRARWLRP